MIYTPKTKIAINLMYDLHKDQVDKSGLPYVFHPFHVAEQMDDEDSTIVALLHDTLEDTEITVDDLRNKGFSENVIGALKLLTHNPNEDYYSYVERIGSNNLARKVKIKDLEHNMDISRLDEINDWDLQRYQKYAKCHQYLVDLEEKESKIRL
ncbi:MAG: GTP pyrophosphokinase [Bacilli bacterium]|nr:GTP pyrophosphokinase [Bacilli bacterium]